MRKSTKLAVLLVVFLGVNHQIQAQEIPDSSVAIPTEATEPPPASSDMPDAANTASPMPEGSTELPMLEDEEDNEVVSADDLADTSAVIVDGYMSVNTYKKAKPIPLPEINQNNVKFYKRIWREIDLKDEKNAAIFFPANGGSLTELIVDAVKKGKIIAYDPRATKKNPTGDGFKTKLTPAQAMARLVDSVFIPEFDENGEKTGGHMEMNEFNPENVTKYRIKEDIFFDKQRARFETRIVGIAPLKKVDAGGEELTQAAFWLYFPHIRKVLVTKEAITDLTYDDIFIQHNFVSKITRDSKSTAEKIEDSALAEKQIQEDKAKVWKY